VHVLRQRGQRVVRSGSAAELCAVLRQRGERVVRSESAGGLPTGARRRFARQPKASLAPPPVTEVAACSRTAALSPLPGNVGANSKQALRVALRI